MLDILTACFFTIFIWVGYKNGFLKSAYKVAAFIASIILAYILYPYIKDFIVGSAFGDMIRSIVQTKYVEPKIASETLTATALPEYMRAWWQPDRRL